MVDGIKLCHANWKFRTQRCGLKSRSLKKSSGKQSVVHLTRNLRQSSTTSNQSSKGRQSRRGAGRQNEEQAVVRTGWQETQTKSRMKRLGSTCDNLAKDWVEITGLLVIDWKHKENQFNEWFTGVFSTDLWLTAFNIYVYWDNHLKENTGMNRKGNISHHNLGKLSQTLTQYIIIQNTTQFFSSTINNNNYT